MQKLFDIYHMIETRWFIFYSNYFIVDFSLIECKLYTINSCSDCLVLKLYYFAIPIYKYIYTS